MDKFHGNAPIVQAEAERRQVAEEGKRSGKQIVS